MNIAVTGASGFVGSRVAMTFAGLGHTVFSFGSRPERELTTALPNYRQWDISCAGSQLPAVDTVVHCAALVGDWGHERAYHRVNVDGTANVLAAFAGARVVYVSTSSVYSDHQPHAAINEDAPVGNCRYSAYARTKAAAENMVLSQQRGVVLRPHIVYGPGDTTLLPRLVAARRFGSLLVPGDGQNRLSVTHVDNLVAAVRLASFQAGLTGVFNVADAKPARLRELLQTVFDRLKLRTNLVFIPAAVAWPAAAALESVWWSQKPPRGPQLTRYLVHKLTATHVLDIRKAQALLGYSPAADLSNATL